MSYHLTHNESPNQTPTHRDTHQHQPLNNNVPHIDYDDDIHNGLYTDDIDIYNNDDYDDVNIQDNNSNNNNNHNTHKLTDKLNTNQTTSDNYEPSNNGNNNNHNNGYNYNDIAMTDLSNHNITPISDNRYNIHNNNSTTTTLTQPPSSTDVDGITVDPSKFDRLMNQSIWMLLRSNPFLIFVSFFAALDGIIFGYDTGVISGIIVFDGFRNDMNLPLSIPGHTDTAHTADIIGWIVGSLMLGSAVSSLVAGQLAHMIGRKISIVIGAAVSILGGVVQATAQHINVLIVGRAIVGVGIGCVSTVVPIYVAEISPKSIRGSLGSLMNLFVTFGQLSAFCVNLAFDKLSHQQTDWRYSLGIQAILAFFLLLGLFALPESPRYLISKQRTDEARHVLKRLRQEIQVGQRIKNIRQLSDGSESIEYESITNIDLEILDVENEINLTIYQHSNYSSWLDLLTYKPYLFPLSIGVLLQLFQQFSGINAIMYYAPTIFSTIQIDRQVASVFTGLVNWLSTFIAVLLIDRVGRRSLLLYGGIAQCISCFIVAILLYTGDPQHSHAVSSGVLFMICLFIFNFAYSWGMFYHNNNEQSNNMM